MRLSSDFRSRVLAREWVCGTFLTIGSPSAVEIAGLAGFDFLVIDHEHGPGGEDTLLHQLLAASATPAAPVVRIALNETARFKRVLDAGASGVMVPLVATADEARAAVAAMRYPPHGIRGVAKSHRGAAYGADFEEYYLHAHERVLGVTQIETPQSLANIDEIAAVEGADVLFMGPTDLTYNMGIRDQFDHPRFLEALAAVPKAAARHGKAAGILVQEPELLETCREFGYTFVSLGSDVSVLRAGLLTLLEQMRRR